MDAHFAVSFQNPIPPPRTCAQNGRIRSEMAEGGRRRAYRESRGGGVAPDLHLGRAGGVPLAAGPRDVAVRPAGRTPSMMRRARHGAGRPPLFPLLLLGNGPSRVQGSTIFVVERTGLFSSVSGA